MDTKLKNEIKSQASEIINELEEKSKDPAYAIECQRRFEEAYFRSSQTLERLEVGQANAALKLKGARYKG